MLFKLLKSFFVLSLGIYSASVFAGCGEVESTCLVIREGETSSQPCEISTCANTSEYITDWILSDGNTVSEHSTLESSVIKVNNADGVSIPYSILQKGLTCYGNNDLSLVLCAKG